MTQEATGKPTLRTITLHLAMRDDAWEPHALSHALAQAGYTLQRLKEQFGRKGYEVWSTRVTLPPPPPRVTIDRLVEARDHLDKSVFLSTGGFTSGDKRIPLIEHLLESGIFTYIAVERSSHLEDLAQTLMKWSLDKPGVMVRIGVEFTGKRDFMTPYFPISSTPETARVSRFTLAFLYPNWIMARLQQASVEEVEKVVAQAVSEANQDAETPYPGVLEYGGIDASLSPWMDDSVARLVELVGRCRMETYGCIPAVASINAILARHGSVGFNEIMLPLGEDNVLKEKAREGRLAIEDLVSLLPFCLAGLDMVALTLNASEFHSLLKTLYTIALWKKRPMGFRGILLPPDYPDEGIKLERFGFIPVLKKKEDTIRTREDEKREGGPLIIP